MINYGKVFFVLLITMVLCGSSFAMYNPQTGRFLSEDPLGYVDGMNLYEYVQSKPVDQADPSGLSGRIQQKFIKNDDYRPGIIPPPDGGYVCGGWNVGELSWKNWEKEQDLKKKLGDWKAAVEIMSLIYPNGASALSHYLGNTGSEYEINLKKLYSESLDARKNLVKLVNNAARKAENLLKECRRPKDLVQKGHTEMQIYDPEDWKLAIGSGWMWGLVQNAELRGSAMLNMGLGGERGCYYHMYLRINFRDNYEFEPGGTWKEMWEFNHYGFARHFKSRGTYGISVMWSKGHDFDILDITEHINSSRPLEGGLSWTMR